MIGPVEGLAVQRQTLTTEGDHDRITDRTTIELPDLETDWDRSGIENLSGH